MGARYFVFVEFSDPEVREFLVRLRETIAGCVLRDSPHITVRGPYSKPPNPDYIAELGDRLQGQGVLVEDIGVFKTDKGQAVFLHAKSKLFDDVWWKPDFSGPNFRRIPHVTIFESTSTHDATTVAEFLRSEAIQIVTYGVELTVHTSRQQSLIAAEEMLVAPRTRLPPERIIFRAGIFERARRLADYMRASQGEQAQRRLF